MNSTRREFLRYAAATGIAAIVPWQRVLAQAQSPRLRKFIQPLPGLGTGIPVANSLKKQEHFLAEYH